LKKSQNRLSKSLSEKPDTGPVGVPPEIQKRLAKTEANQKNNILLGKPVRQLLRPIDQLHRLAGPNYELIKKALSPRVAVDSDSESNET